MKRILIAILILTGVLGIAVAQEVEPSLRNISEWFSNPLLGIGVVAAFVQWIRKIAPNLDGPIVVPAVALIAGAAGGAFGQLAGMLAVEPFSSLSTPLGGIAYGLSAGVGAVFGVNLFELLAGKLGKALIGLVNSGDETVDPAPTDTAAASRLRR